MKKKTIIIIAALVVIVLAIVLTLANNKNKIDASKQVVDRSSVPVYVSTFTAAPLPIQGNLNVPAVLSANEEASISSSASGKIVSLHIELGSKVSKGQIIGVVDIKQKELNLKSTELNVEKLNNDYERDKILLQGNAATESAVTKSKYDYETNKIQADLIRQQIKDGNIVSPISGIITDKKLIAGEYVNIGAQIASVVDISKLKAVVFVGENDVFKLKEGDKVKVTTDVFPGTVFNGAISFISPKGDDNHNYRVEIAITNNNSIRLKAGIYVMAEFNVGGNATVLQIPKRALVEGVKNPYVFIASGNKSLKRRIALGREIGENIEVLSGLTQGEEVITDGQINLIDGSKIETAKK
ncbi:MAG: efflux RND transporter periplasmic adaptor subunit [Cytophagaceae bacterium]|nr:efflux RND transporter periplasmic adaptor subunit [Cytophagaceae bacterium]